MQSTLPVECEAFGTNIDRHFSGRGIFNLSSIKGNINQCVYFAKFGILNPSRFRKMDLNLSILEKLPSYFKLIVS